MELSSQAATVILWTYYVSLGTLVVFSVVRTWLVWRPGPRPSAPAMLRPGSDPALFPHVAVQLPLRNEATVVERLIDAAAGLAWPHQKLTIQVLDDSSDHTVELAQARVAHHAARGVPIHYVRGPGKGFKAGALQHGMGLTDAELVAVFDADFVPPSDFLQQLVPHFADPKVGMVQARWGHLNAATSLLTRTQALLLDAHFCVEQAGRHARGAWFNFNGTAGVWRRAAMEQAGGWRADTLTEDLDLSYRAQLCGWRFVYRDDVLAPAELPEDMAALVGQQHRWTKGSAQTARMLLPRLWLSPAPLRRKFHATVHLLGNLAYLFMLALCALAPAVAPSAATLGLHRLGGLDAVLWAVGLGSLAVFYASAAARSGHGIASGLWRLTGVMVLGTGLCVRNARAVAGALAGVHSPFVRTPKRGSSGVGSYRAEVWAVRPVELMLAGWLAVGAVLAGQAGRWTMAGVQVLMVAGLSWVALAGLAHLRRSAAAVPNTTSQLSQAVRGSGTQVTPVSESCQTL